MRTHPFKTKQELIASNYYQDIRRCPRIYDTYRDETGEEAGVHAGLHEALLQRLHGNFVKFEPFYLGGYGLIDVPCMQPVDIEAIRDNERLGNTHISVFETDQGTVHIDWYFMVLVMKPRQENEALPHHTLAIRSFEPLHVTTGGEGYKNYTIHLRLHIGEPVSYLLEGTTFHVHPSDVHAASSHINFDRIERGAVTLETKGDILPEKPVTLKYVADKTDVAASTLSYLRSGKQSISKLSTETASRLTKFGDIRFLDKSFIDKVYGSILRHTILDDRADTNNSDQPSPTYALLVHTVENNRQCRYIVYHDREAKHTETKAYINRELRNDTGKSTIVLGGRVYKDYTVPASRADTVFIDKQTVTGMTSHVLQGDMRLGVEHLLVIVMKNGSIYEMKSGTQTELDTVYDTFVRAMEDHTIARGAMDSMTSTDGTHLYALRGEDISDVYMKRLDTGIIDD